MIPVTERVEHAHPDRARRPPPVVHPSQITRHASDSLRPHLPRPRAQKQRRELARARLGEIAAPTLVVVGELDEETPPAYSEAIAAGIPGARLEVIAGAGHYTSFEAPDALNALLRDHLDMVEAV